MGNRESTIDTSPLLSVEDAKQLLTCDELKRIETAWDARDSLSPDDFFNEVFSHPGISSATRTLIYSKFCQGAPRLTFNNFLVAIALLTRASQRVRNDFLCDEPQCASWITNPPQLTCQLSEIHYNFYQVLAGVTHLDEIEVEELEKVFGSINDTKLCKLTKHGFVTLVGGAIDPCFLDGLFSAFDENRDGLIDFKELVCGLSASCRGPDTARLNFAAQLFDEDSDGFFTEADISSMYKKLKVPPSKQTLQSSSNSRLSLTDFVCWANDTGCANQLIEAIQQIGHICLGLRPCKPEVELIIVSGFKTRITLDAFTEWNIISSDWWLQWVQGLMSNCAVPPINNSSIISSKARNDWTNKAPSLSCEGAPLRQGLTLRRDYEILAPCLWKSLLRWHGSAAQEGVSLPRRVVPASFVDPLSKSSETVIELYPPTLLILRHTSASSSWLQSALEWSKESTMKQSQWCSVTFSRASTVSELLNFLTQQLKINDIEAARLWLLEVDGKPCRKLLDDDARTLHDLCIVNTAQLLLELRNSDMSWPEEVLRLEAGADSEGSESEDPNHGRGVTGIYNMGNTCYMNSAIQCLSNTRPLTAYFLEGRHKDDIKKSKKVSNGIVSLEYGKIIEDLWSGKRRNIAPIKLRDAISSSAGGIFKDRSQQHDCQEFLVILLDLLHEDLNRVLKKPYKELSDSAGRPDVIVAEEAWEAHIQRENSIIVDLFTGQLRSSLSCSKCKDVSCRFDPFTCLQLPIPIDNLLLLPVVVVRRDGRIPTRYGFRLSPTMKIGEFKEELAKKCSLPSTLLRILCLNRTGQVMNNLLTMANENEHPISIYPSDALFYAFELPCSKLSLSSKNDVQPAPTVIAAHRKMQYNDTYLLGATAGCKPLVFGVPLLVHFTVGKTKGNELYEEVWRQVSRFLQNSSSSEEPLRVKGVNRAVDPGEDIRSGYPFDLCIVDSRFEWCAKCPWSSFCHGCVLKRTDDVIEEEISALAVDWKPAALYLRYQHSVELLCVDDESFINEWDIHYRPCSLVSCLKDFTQEELLDDEVFCKKCNQKTPTTKALSIWRLPDVLIIHFKRFVHVETEKRWVKSYKVVDFPLRNLDLSEWSRGNYRPDKAVYNCFAIANHYGAMASGHYVAYARNGDHWYMFNDSRCQAVRESQVDKRSAYLLFYERVTPENKSNGFRR
ncbi:hypothetical protein AB6A40_000196 [Gnathostoma spinigerum]|uniref:ubiquitinyl hydrolase 1 n=1 Tax=Gnathostoma spinigerum TaxID=75299 RepID=A0ABD6E9Y2_9BILA